MFNLNKMDKQKGVIILIAIGVITMGAILYISLGGSAPSTIMGCEDNKYFWENPTNQNKGGTAGFDSHYV